jgi:hypothetical protein
MDVIIRSFYFPIIVIAIFRPNVLIRPNPWPQWGTIPSLMCSNIWMWLGSGSNLRLPGKNLPAMSNGTRTIGGSSLGRLMDQKTDELGLKNKYF